jgi:hypothetical protein
LIEDIIYLLMGAGASALKFGTALTVAETTMTIVLTTTTIIAS